MRSIDIIRRSGRSLLSAKTRTLLTAFAIAVGAFALSLTLAASNGATSYADKLITDNFDPTELTVSRDSAFFDPSNASKPEVYNPNFGSFTSPNGFTRQIDMMSDADIAKLKTLPGVSSVQPVTSLSLQYITRDGQKKYVATVVPFDSFRNPTILAGKIPETIPNGSVILPEGFVNSLGFASAQDAIGKQIRLAVRRQQDQSTLIASVLSGKGVNATGATASASTTEEHFKIIAVTKAPTTLFSAATALNININPADLTKLNDVMTQGSSNYHKYISVSVQVAGGQDAAKLSAVQTEIKHLGYNAQSVFDTQKIITQVISVLQGIVTVFGIIAVVASVFGVVNTMYISVLQRTREIGLMKALGMHRIDIYKLFLYEAGLIGMLGGIIGTAVAFLVGTFANPLISKQLNIGDVSLLNFQLWQLILLIVSLALVAVIAGLLPARKAATLDPIEALRTE